MGTIAISGSASGIGAATASRLRAAGHRVIGIDRPGTAVDVEADLGTAEGRARAIDATVAACGGHLDAAVLAAGLGSRRATPDIVRVNYFGAVALAEGLRPCLTAAGDATGDAALVLLSSNSTTTAPGIPLELVELLLAGREDDAVAGAPDDGRRTYPATKLALAWWMREQAVRAEWIGHRVRINAVAPGVTRTALTADLPQPTADDPTAGRDIPARRWGEPDDMAAVVCFLASREASYVVGQTVFVDGGLDARTQPRGHPRPLA